MRSSKKAALACSRDLYFLLKKLSGRSNKNPFILLFTPLFFTYFIFISEPSGGVMNLDRRSFFATAAALGISSSVAEALAFAQKTDATSNTPEGFDRETFEFWTKRVRQPSEVFERTGHLPLVAKGANSPADVDFLYFDRDNGFQLATDSAFGENGLVGKGDVALSMSVDTIRPSGPHRDILQKSGTGSFRVDLKQGPPLRMLSEPLNWSAIGSFQGMNAGVIHNLQFDPTSTWGAAKQVPLAAGTGFWAWNLSVQKAPSKWTQMLQGLSGLMGGFKPSGKSGGKSGSKSAPAPSEEDSTTPSGLGLTTLVTAAFSVIGVGLPSIAKTAFDTIDQVYGFLHSQGGSKPEPVFQMQDAPVLATQEARQAHNFRAVSVKPGTYLVVSAAARSEVMSGKYSLLDYDVVPTGTKAGESREAADNSLQNVSYCVISVDVASPSS